MNNNCNTFSVNNCKNVNSFDKLNVLFINARSLNNNLKLQELQFYIKEYDLHILGICETWLNDNITDAELFIKDFCMFRKDRNLVKDGRGGGVLMYVRNSLNVLPVNDLNSLNNESVWCKILDCDRKETLVGVVYRSPNCDAVETESIISMLKSLTSQSVVVMGDFNFPNIDWENLKADKNGELFLDMVMDNFWFQHVAAPTRANNILDLVISSDVGMVDNVTIKEHLANSDHNIIVFDLIIDSNARFSKEERLNFFRGDYVEMNRCLSCIDWELEFEGLDVESMWNKFLVFMRDSMTLCIPKSKTKKCKYPVWMTREAIRARKKKAKLWKKYSASKNFVDKALYTEASNQATTIYRRAKYSYEKELAYSVKNNTKRFFAYTRSKTKIKDTVSSLKDKDGNILTDDIAICDELNKYFSSVFTKELTDPPTFTTRFIGNNDDFLNNIEVTEQLVFRYLNNLCVDKAPGPDGLSPKVLKETSGTISKPLSMIFSASLSFGYVPGDWRVANVSALFKKGSKSDPGNYRPVSLTSCVCKLLERIIKDQLMNHLTKFNLINSSQHGFIQKRSCLTNLLDFLNFTHRSVDAGEAVDVIYLDFSKAFDKVPHNRLLSKIKAYGIGDCLVSWIRNWLENRSQRVMFNGSYSSWASVESGVPQGSVLGPLLFIIYINDIDDGIVNKLSKFADDTKLFGRVSSPEQIIALQQDLIKLFDWSQDWLMLFNIDKCKVLHFGYHNILSSYELGGQVLAVAEEEKDLGVLVSSDLKVASQCAKAASSANRMLGVISRSFCCKSIEITLRLYKALVRPHLDYCVQVWRPHYQKDIDLLEKVQRRATRMVEGFKDISYEDRLQLLGLTTLQTRRLRGDLIEMFKIIKGMYCIDASEFFTFSDSNTRGHDLKLYKDRFCSNIGKFSFCNRSVDLWNLLPNNIVACNSVNSFKNNLDRYLYDKGFK